MVGVIVLAASIPILLDVVMLFGPPEIFLLAVWGLTLVASVSRGSLRTGRISAMLVLLIAMHGFNPQTTTVRWAYGLTFMWGGFGLIPPVVGLFAVAEMMDLLSKGESIAKGTGDDGSSGGSSTDSGTYAEGSKAESTLPEKGGRKRGILSVFKHWSVFLRSSIIGVVIGVIPGVGGSAANYVAYFQALKTSKNSENFGKGDVRGLIASEASNDAKDGGSLMPTLALGVPGSATTAILLGAFIMQGIQPGPFLLSEHLDIVVVIIATLLFSNVLTSVLGISIANYLTKITQIDIKIIAPMVIGIAFFGTFAASQTVYDLFLLALFGIVGYVMILTGISRIPLILGLVLGPIAEKQFWRSLAISGNDPAVFTRSTVAVLLLIGLVLSLIQPILVPLAKQQIRKLREVL
jgi:putative tricarboxylic transport membrane protein